MYPCSEEHGIFFISKIKIIVEHQLNGDLKVILTTLIYLYKFIMIEVSKRFYHNELVEIRTGDLRDENQLTFKHETNNKLKRAALPLS